MQEMNSINQRFPLSLTRTLPEVHNEPTIAVGTIQSVGSRWSLWGESLHGTHAIDFTYGDKSDTYKYIAYVWKRMAFSFNQPTHVGIVESAFEKLQPKTVTDKLRILDTIEREVKRYDAQNPADQPESFIDGITRYFGLHTITPEDKTKFQKVMNTVLHVHQPATQPKVNKQAPLAQRKMFSKEASAAPNDASQFVLTDTFKDVNGDPVIHEKCERIPTTDILHGELRAKITHYEELLAKAKTPKEKAHLEAELARFNKQLTNWKPVLRGATKWSSTNAHKTFFKNHATTEVETCDRLAPILTNHRNQTVRDGEGNLVSSINRSGAITDFGHGELSLQELQDYLKLKELHEKGRIFPMEEAERLMKLYALGNPINKKKLEVLVDGIEKRAIDSYDKKILNENGVGIDPVKLKAICIDRQERLASQVLQDIYIHLTKVKAAGQNVSVSRIALINTGKAAEGKNRPDKKRRFVNSEKTQALDMKAIYDSFDGRTIVFDEKETYPFIDEKGRIHMPSSLHEAGPCTTTLTTNFFNMSVQGNTKNQGAQREINDAAVHKMMKRGQRNNALFIANKIENLGGSSNDTNEHIADVVELLQGQGHFVSIDCYGGKDRTGYLLAVVTFRKLMKSAKSETAQEVQWKDQLVGKSGILCRVISENIGTTVAKLSALSLNLFKQHQIMANQFAAVKLKVDSGLGRVPAVKDIYDEVTMEE